MQADSKIHGYVYIYIFDNNMNYSGLKLHFESLRIKIQHIEAK